MLGTGFIAGGALAGLGAFGRLGPFSAWVGLVLSLVVNVLMYWGGFAVVVRIPDGQRAVWPGAVIGGVGWTVLQFAGAHAGQPPAPPSLQSLRHLRHRPRTHLVARPRRRCVTVYAAEFNVVLSRHLWPRSIRRAWPNRPE